VHRGRRDLNAEAVTAVRAVDPVLAHRLHPPKSPHGSKHVPVTHTPNP
jgi:hypothetical protein